MCNILSFGKRQFANNFVVTHVVVLIVIHSIILFSFSENCCKYHYFHAIVSLTILFKDKMFRNI